MHAVCEGFDDFFSRWYPDIRRLCFAMTENDKDARNLAFKTFLRLGAAKDPQIKENDAKFLLFSSGFTLCVDYFGRKPRRLPDKKALEGMSLPFAVTDNLCVFLKLPLARRGAFCLAHAGFSEAEIAKIAGKSAAHFAFSSTPKADSAREAVSSILFDESDADAKNKGLQEATSNVYGNGHTSLFADMMDAIEHDRKPYVDAVAGRNALEMILAIYQSAATGKPVKLPLEHTASTDFEGRFD